MSTSEIKPLRKISGDHDYSLDDSFGRRAKVITETAYFRGGDFVVAIGRLDRPNRWNDEALERAMKHLQCAWNDALKAEITKDAK